MIHILWECRCQCQSQQVNFVFSEAFWEPLSTLLLSRNFVKTDYVYAGSVHIPFHCPTCSLYKRHWQLIRSKLGFYFSFGITLNVDVFFFGALPIDTLKIKHTKKLKEIPSRHFPENLPGKASMYAFIHLKLIGNLQGFN